MIINTGGPSLEILAPIYDEFQRWRLIIADEFFAYKQKILR